MERIKIVQYKRLDDAQRAHQDWRKALGLFDFETREDIFDGFRRELSELDEEVKNESKNRLNIAGEAADILLYSVAMLDQEGVSFSSLLANGDSVVFLNNFRKLQKKE